MHRSLAALFGCALVAGCGGSAPSGSIGGPTPSPSANHSLRFFGSAAGDVDRVKIPLLGAAAAPLPINIGATSFTIELWIKGTKADNNTASCTVGPIGRDAWTTGAVVVDRDVLGDGDFGDYGVALFNGQVTFGVSHSAGGTTACGGSDVLDGAWHHVALTRAFATGELTIFVDGAQDVRVADASSNVSYNPAHPNPAPNDPFLVLGAEKFDNANAKAFNGLIDELRVSTMLRYTGTFPRPSTPFTLDGNTAALYHFDEASGTVIGDAAGTSPGVLIPAGAMAVHHSTDTPF
jgi:Concanavalin A-like lectin/glucanases superfamily